MPANHPSIRPTNSIQPARVILLPLFSDLLCGPFYEIFEQTERLTCSFTKAYTFTDKHLPRARTCKFILQFTHKNMRYNFAYSDYMANRYLRTVATALAAIATVPATAAAAVQWR